MPRARWSEEELAALAAIAPHDRAALAAFRRRYPGHSVKTVNAKRLVLRIRQLAADVDHLRRADPFPKYRFD